MEMFSIEETRVIMKFLWKCGESKEDIYTTICNKVGPTITSLRTVGRWIDRFNSGDYSVINKQKPGRPVDVKNIAMVELEVKNDPFISSREIGRRLSICKDTVTKILRENLKMKKVNCKWIPHLLNDNQKLKRIQIATEMLKQIKESEYDNTVILTGDETWIRWNNPHRSMWLLEGESPPQIPKHKISSKKQ